MENKKDVKVMEEFNYQQKISMMRILLDIINADGRIDVRETALFNKLAEDFGLEEEARTDVDAKSSILSLIEIKNFTPDQKKYYANLMNRMIVIDEDVNVNEVAIYDIVTKFCGIPISFKTDTSDTQATST
jgi:hypothetical protein